MPTLSNLRATCFARTLTWGAIAGALGLLAFLPTSAFAAPPPPPPNAPQDIEVTDGSVPFLLWHAIGTQNYVCQLVGGAYTWTFVGPSATLYDEKGKQVATHFAGPTWQAQDGSRVIGAVEASVMVAPDAIPWLRLRAASTVTGPKGGDRLAPTTFIQRVNTTGGLKPTSGCIAGTVGAAANISYTADYYFYRHRD